MIRTNEGSVLEANDAFLRIVGYDREDLVAGRIRWTDLAPPEWRDRDIQAMAELEKTGTVQPFEKEYVRKDGSRVPVLIGVAVSKEAGTRGSLSVLDMSARKTGGGGSLRERAALPRGADGPGACEPRRHYRATHRLDRS